MPVAKIYNRIRRVLKLHPHDTSTERGQSHERYRRMALTSAAAFGLLANNNRPAHRFLQQNRFVADLSFWSATCYRSGRITFLRRGR
jgi:hypothetical protein